MSSTLRTGRRVEYAERTLPVVLERIETLRVAADVLRHLAVCEHLDAESCGAWMRSALATGPSAG